MKTRYRFSLLILLALLVSCQTKKPIEIKQIDSKEMVTLIPSLKNPSMKDSVVLSIPTEFRIIINSSNVGYIVWRYRANGKVFLDDITDYQVCNKKNKLKLIYNLNFDEIPKDNFIDIIIKERNRLISKAEAYNLLKKYKINKSIDHLKIGDTVKLVTYDKFRIENKDIINSLNKVQDSIDFKAMRGKDENFYTSKKINW
ncbi:hypothetical protein NU08_1808 [Flavobacterium anhuiense]|uniref:Lipoprotein n=1 Tax=Flavobacterium anhuiense TaxID=459526 RepID=A0A444VZA2_9FLAO|nr:hypothetical protein [Flavobacterium anhuiense]RYJ38970.1 hypothetical protein NU08_1808 [Flavobacterium anhuiense]